MAKFVFASVPAFGHFNPILPIVAELVRRGHQVTVINSAEFEQTVTALGADFLAFPIEFTSRQLADILVNGNLGHAMVVAREAALAIVPWLNEQLGRLAPDAVAYDPQALYAHIACKMLALPCASIFPYPVIEATRHMLDWRTSLAAMRQNGPFLWRMLATRFQIQRRFGTHTFPTTRPRFQSRGDITIMLTIPQLQRPDAWRDDTMIYVGPSIDQSVRQVDFPFDALDGRPLVLISLGTLATGDLAFFRSCLRALAPLPAQFVMSIGRTHKPEALGEIPDNFIVRSYIPQLQILERAAGFVTHAGSTGFHEALWYGVPMVGIPQQIEQLMNARLAAEHGACIPIESHFLGRPVDEADLRTAVETVLGDASYAQAARRLQALLRRSGGFRQAADELEKLAVAAASPPAAPAA